MRVREILELEETTMVLEILQSVFKVWVYKKKRLWRQKLCPTPSWLRPTICETMKPEWIEQFQQQWWAMTAQAILITAEKQGFAGEERQRSDRDFLGLNRFAHSADTEVAVPSD